MSHAWLDHNHALNEPLALLLGLRRAPDARDVDLALHARNAVLDLATAVHHDVTGLHSTRRPRVDDPDRYTHPVAHLGRLLNDRRRPEAKTSPLEALASSPQDDVGDLWQQAAREATLAHDAWARVSDGDKRLGPASWTAVHQLAQHCVAVTWLDEELAFSCEHAGRNVEARILRDGSSRLRSPAMAVAELAASGPLDPLPDVRAPAQRRALAVRGFEHTPAGTERLSELLRSSDHVTPQQVQAGYRVLGRLLQRSADVVLSRTPLRAPSGQAAPGRVGLAQELAALGEVLRRSGREPGRARSLLPADEPVATQLGQLSLAAGAGIPATWAVTPGAAVRVADRLAANAVQATYALEECVTRNLEDGRWLVPAGEQAPFDLTWVFSEPRHALVDELDAPTLLRSAARASARADTAAATLPPASWRSVHDFRSASPQIGATPRDLLTAALRDAGRRALPQPARPYSVRAPARS